MMLVTVVDDRMGRKNGLYGQTQKRIEALFRNNPQFGIKDFLMMTFEDIQKTDFYEQNKTLLDNIDPARNGRAYKPYAIQQALKQVEEGDFIVYTDASPEMWRFDEDYKIPSYYSLNILKNLCTNNGGILTVFVKWDTRTIYPHQLGIHTHENFTLDRCMKYMGLEGFAKSFMGASGMITIQKSPKTVAFVDEWLHYNTIDECCALGKSEVPNDYSFWTEEDGKKLGARADQSILGLLLCKYGYKMVDIFYNNLNPYNFLNFCRECVEYKFIDPNTVPDEKRIKKGDKVVNKKGVELTVFDVTNVDGKERLVVGIHKASCYETSPSQVKLL